MKASYVDMNVHQRKHKLTPPREHLTATIPDSRLTDGERLFSCAAAEAVHCQAATNHQNTAQTSTRRKLITSVRGRYVGALWEELRCQTEARATANSWLQGRRSLVRPRADMTHSRCENELQSIDSCREELSPNTIIWTQSPWDDIMVQLAAAAGRRVQVEQEVALTAYM